MSEHPTHTHCPAGQQRPATRMIVGMIVPGSLAASEVQARIDDEIAELHQAISKLHSRISALCTQRNQLSLASRLPSEILSTVFIHCASMWHKITTDRVPEWVNVSYVCHHWRDVALNCPTLWTYISTTSEHWTNVLLSRSKQAPLRICFGWVNYQPHQSRLLERVLDHIERIQELKLGFPLDDYEKVSSMLSSPAPLLRSLAVRLTGHSLSLIPAIRPFFAGAFPALRRLELSQCPMPQLTSTLGSLTTLILRNTFRITTPQLMTTLCSMQSLVHLELHSAIPPELDTHSTNDEDNSRLPHLLRLVIDDIHPSNIIKLLPRLNISSQTEVRIRASSPISDDEWMSFRSFLAKRFFTSGDNPPCIHTLVIDVDKCGNTTFVFSGSVFNGPKHTNWSFEPHWGRNIPLAIGFVDMQSDHFREIMQDAYSSGFLAGLRSAHLTLDNDARDDRSATLEDVLGLVPELRYIRLIRARRSLGHLFSFLSLIRLLHEKNRDDDSASGLGQPLPLKFAPALEELVLDFAEFDCSDQDEMISHHGSTVSNLCEALAVRKDKGHILNRLILTKCRNVFQQDVAKLRNLVHEVVWDGIEEENHSDGEDQAVDDE